MLAIIIASFVTLTSAKAVAEEFKKPNILFIMSDDHAYQAISAYKNKRKLNQTPNIDKLAERGTLFEKSYVVNSICGPSRAAILTGKYSHKNNYKTNFKDFDSSQMTFPKILQSEKSSYETAIIGKWHLGSDPKGFDYWNIISKKDRGGQGSYFNPIMRSNSFAGVKEKKITGYNTDIIKELGIEWIEARRNKDKPFMMMLHFKAPHREWEPHPSKMAMYDLVSHKEPVNLHDDYSTRTSAAHFQTMSLKYDMLGKDTKLVWPKNLNKDQMAAWKSNYTRVVSQFVTKVNSGYFGKMSKADFIKYAIGNIRQYGSSAEQVYNSLVKTFGLNLNAVSAKGDFKENGIYSKRLVSWKYKRYMDDYLACISSVDDAVGEVVEALKKQGLYENTIIVYTADQGFYLGEHGWYDKRFMYEESLRTPLIIAGPGVKHVRDSKNIVANVDIAETILDYAGIKAPKEMQGISMRPILEGRAETNGRNSFYYQYYQHPGTHNVYRHSGVTTRRYKLIYFEDVKEWELYDLKEDPNEMNNLYKDDAHQKVVQMMKKEWSLQRKLLDVPESEPHRNPKLLKKI